MSAWKAVVFDMDGVIIDSEPFHYEVNKKIYSELGLDITRGEYEEFIGLSNTDMWAILTERYNLKKTVKELVEKQMAENINYLDTYSHEPISGLAKLLGEFTGLGKKIGLASSSPKKYIWKVLDELSIINFFSTVVSGEEMERGKPEPDIYIKVACQLGVQPENCLAIEDSENGVISAVSAGMKCIGFSQGEEFSQSQSLDGADITVSSLSDISGEMVESLFN